jgi:predicted alpha/beta-fold hydrolase
MTPPGIISRPTFRPGPFRAHPLVRGGHAQTILGCYLPHRVLLAGTRHHHIALPDGDTLVLHDDQPAEWLPGERVVLLIHGLGGCHGSPYMQRLAMKLYARGVRAFRLDLRGCGASYALARWPAHAGRSEDALAAIEFLATLCPDSPVTLMGFSLGGNITLKLLGECGAAPPGCLDSAVAVGPPIDLAFCAQNMDRGWNWLYDRSFIKTLNTLVKRRRRELPRFADDIDLTPPPRKLTEFDDRYTAPLSGFAGLAD